MNRVRCLGCRNYVDREGCIQVGLGWCCNEGCRREMQQRRWEHGIGKTVPEDRHGSGPRAGKGRTVTLPSPGKRRFVIKRDGHRCRFCGQRAKDVHHINYRSEGGGHDEYNLILLCRPCHERMHSNKRRWKPVLLALIWLQYVEGRFLTVPQVERLLAQRGLVDSEAG